MFSVDVVSLRQFYGSVLGRSASRLIRTAVARQWPVIREGEVLMALGYCFPYIEGLTEAGVNVLPMMLASHGAIYWPAEGDNRTLLLKDKYLPLQDNTVDRVLLVHALEHSRNVNQTLDELWRVMVPGAKLLLVVPNRRSIWAQAASTPFGFGQPFTAQQLAKKLEEKRFTPVSHRSALHILPLSWRWLQRAATTMEWLGDFLFPFTGGIIVMEAEKQIYAAIAEPVKEAKPSALYPTVAPVISRERA